jgi:CSLREA domain-containing protein
MLLGVLACGLALPAAGLAFEVKVNSAADEVDAAPGDEKCETAAGDCTLRAAIEEGNALAESITIEFDEETFDGQVANTISLTGSLPAIGVPATLNGRICETDAEVSGPCVGIEGSSGEPALIAAAEEVQVFGLAISDAQTAIELEGSPRSKVQASWLGVSLDGAITPNQTGVLVGTGSNRSLIGGEGPGFGNVFAGNSTNGLDVHGGNNVRVFGNYFGVEPDGVTPAPNGGDAIEVASFEGSEVTGTAVGTRVSAAAAASPPCDGGCNLISGAGSSGVDLQGDGGLETPAASTSVLGNYVGLDANGAAAVPNTGAGVRVGEAAHTLVGGPAAGEANRINGGSVAVLAGPAAPDLAIRGNLIGIDATGTGVLDPPDDGVVIDSAELASPAAEAEIVDNLIGMEGGVAIAQRGEGAWILGNEIFGSQVGIRTFESAVEHGNVVEDNAIEGPAVNGILLETGFNEVVGNEVLGAGAAGIRILGSPPFGVSRNLIGGDTAAEENVIEGSGGAAVEITDLEETDNEVARNVGRGNAGSFIDLIAASPATEVGPNRGIEPPVFSTLTSAGASGGAKEGALVRVFLKRQAASGEIDSFLGEAVADGVGGWEVGYDSAIPPGSIVAATQTLEGATSELAIATTPGSQDIGGGAVGVPEGIAGSGLDEVIAARQRPQTTISRVRARNRTVRFVFASDPAGARFLCRLDGRPFDLCRSPKRYVGLSPGKHVFWVRAIDPAGRVDLSPAKRTFVVHG